MLDINFLNEKEYDFLRTDKRLGDNVHILAFGGSHAYGTNVPTSDIDVRGIASNSIDDVILNKGFEEITDNTTDTVIYSVEKMFRLLAQCNPNTIEIVGVKDYLKVDEIGKMILDNKSIFLSNACTRTFGGYATQQLYRLRQKTLNALEEDELERHIAKVLNEMDKYIKENFGISDYRVYYDTELKIDMPAVKGFPMEKLYDYLNTLNCVVRDYHKRSVRNEKAIAHNKINKHAMHLLRLFMMEEDLLLRGEVITYREKEYDLLMAIRNGEFYDTESGQMTAEFFKLLEDYEKRVEYAKEHSILPNKPNMKAIDKLQLDIFNKRLEMR